MKHAIWDQIEGRWHQLRGSLRERWGHLTDDDVTEIDGKREKLSGKLQAYYGKTREEVETEIDEWADALDAE